LGAGERPLNHEDHEDHKDHEGVTKDVEAIGRHIVDAGLKVHRALGPGLLESAYEHCLAHELQLRGISVRRQLPMPIVFEGLQLDVGYRLDLLVGEAVVVEVKAAETLSRLHEAQLLTYLKLSGRRLGYLMNFNVPLFKEGLRRVLL
jgi:GxxExxY protein